MRRKEPGTLVGSVLAGIINVQDWDNTTLSMQVLASSPDCIKIIDADGRVVFMNHAGLGLMEIDDFAALAGTCWADAWPLESRHEIDRAVQSARAGEVARVSGFCPTAKGTPKWWDVVVSPLRRADGTVGSILAISRDVTDRKTIESKLIGSEQRFRALADNMAQLAWMADATGAIFWYNRRWYDFTGATEDQCLGWGWQAVHHPDHVDRVIRKISSHFASGEPWEDTFPLRSVDGEYRWFLSRAEPIRDDMGAVALWCGTNTDITEQRNSGARLRQMARLIELSHEAILVWDLKDGIVLWNEGCEELYGFTRSEAVGAHSHDLLRTVHPIGKSAFLSTLLEQGEWTGELQHFAKDGSEVWVDSRQELIRFGDRSVVLETNRDITERRRADATRDLLIAELNHRVKNTLAVVQSIATQTARAKPDPKVFVSLFIDRVQALSTVHNLLNEADWKGVDLRTLVARLADGGLSKGRLTLDGDPVVISAQTALHCALIFHELATNARQHGALSRGTGEVIVAWRVADEASGRCVEVVWRESGGPKVDAARPSGFGLTLIERSGNLPGLKTELRREVTGIVCRLTMALGDAQAVAPAYFNPRQKSAHASAPLSTGAV